MHYPKPLKPMAAEGAPHFNFGTMRALYPFALGQGVAKGTEGGGWVSQSCPSPWSNKQRDITGDMVFCIVLLIELRGPVSPDRPASMRPCPVATCTVSPSSDGRCGIMYRNVSHQVSLDIFCFDYTVGSWSRKWNSQIEHTAYCTHIEHLCEISHSATCVQGNWVVVNSTHSNTV